MAGESGFKVTELSEKSGKAGQGGQTVTRKPDFSIDLKHKTIKKGHLRTGR